MPQASDELRAEWPEGDGEALQHLHGRFGVQAGVIYPYNGTVPTEKDWSAIDYLFQEWDYAYDPDLKDRMPHA